MDKRLANSRKDCVAVPLLLCLASPALAHAPYELPERVLTDTSGRTLQLVKRYTDGILFADPVQLIVRDSRGAALAETQAGRDVGVLCWRGRACVVYRYDGSMPLAPDDVWRLHDGALVRTDSTILLMLGVVAPLWNHWLGYLIAIGLFFSHFAAVTRVWQWRRTAARGVVLVALGIFAPAFLLLWLYALIGLSELSLTLATLVIGAVAFLSPSVRRVLTSPGDRLEEMLGGAG